MKTKRIDQFGETIVNETVDNGWEHVTVSLDARKLRRRRDDRRDDRRVLVCGLILTATVIGAALGQWISF